MKKIETKKIALASLLCALAVVISVIGCVFDMVDLVAAGAASLIVALSKIELGGKYPYLIFFVTGALLFLLFPSATVTLYFLLFFGYYPLIRTLLIRLPRPLCTVLKFAVFNLAIVAIYFLMTKLLFYSDTSSEAYLIPALWLVANLFFAVFDYSMDVFMNAYLKVLRKRWGIDKFMLH